MTKTLADVKTDMSQLYEAVRKGECGAAQIDTQPLPYARESRKQSG